MATNFPQARPQRDPEKERLAHERSAREMRMAVIIIVSCMGIAAVLGMVILAIGHFGM